MIFFSKIVLFIRFFVSSFVWYFYGKFYVNLFLSSFSSFFLETSFDYSCGCFDLQRLFNCLNFVFFFLLFIHFILFIVYHNTDFYQFCFFFYYYFCLFFIHWFPISLSTQNYGGFCLESIRYLHEIWWKTIRGIWRRRFVKSMSLGII